MSGAETLANSTFGTLISGQDFGLPAVVNLTDPKYGVPAVGTTADAVLPLTNASLTTGAVDGTGTFDCLMAGVKSQLDLEFKANRITGAEYAKTYIALTQSAMAAAVQFLVSRDQAYWASVQAQVLVATARVTLETSKNQLAGARAQALLTEAEFALTKMKIATESAGYDQAIFATTQLGPAQLALVIEQKETARGQTMDTRSDGVTAITGAVGKQKALYDQQIASYKRDAENKFAKFLSDAWITQKTLDEGLSPPTSFTNASIDAVMGELKTNLNL